jgi:two-component system nitrate/nitrite response regulator NarL
MRKDRKERFKVALVSDHDVFAEGLGMVLCMQEGIDVVGLARGGAEALTMATLLRPDVLIVDSCLPDAEVDHLLLNAGHTGLDTLILLLTDRTAAPAQPLGVDALLSKCASGRQLADAIRALVEGQHHMLSSIVAATREPARRRRPDTLEVRMGGLTRRERQVLALVVRGYSNQRIASECTLSLNTVRAHVQSVLIKLGVHSRLEAAAFAVATGHAR